MTNQKGFTLIEVLLVLSMVLVISSTVLFVSSSFIDKKAFQLFINQFKLDIYHLQSLSIHNGTYTELVFGDNGTSYTAKKSFYEPVVKRHFPKGIKLSKSSSLTDIAFHPNGTIEKFGTLVFDTPDGVIQLRVYIGKGRMTVEE
jgi:competence protein ComGD